MSKSKLVGLPPEVPPVERKEYTHTVLTFDGFQFSIHKDEASAQKVADQIKGTITPFIPNPTSYWNDTIGAGRYDH